VRTFLLLKSFLFSCVVVPACSAPAQDAASAKAFLQTIYARYHKDGPGVDVSGAKAARFLHSSLVALLRQDARVVGPGEVGALDGDPLCSCQDWDGIYDLKIDVHEVKEDRAEARVSFALFEPAKAQDLRSLVITLAGERGAWRVWDVVDRSDAKAVFDLRSALEKEIREYSKGAKRTPSSQ
jgi:hypothetical protein